MRGFIRGVKDLGKFLSDSDPALDTCKGMEDDMARIKKWSYVFTNPETLAWTLMANAWGHHAELMDNVRAVDADVSTKQFKDMGEHTGQMLINALGTVGSLQDYHLAEDVFPALDKDHQHCQMTTIVPGYCTDFYYQLYSALD